jgi:hypothetical protein
MMNWKGFARKRSWPNRGTIPVFAWGTEENHENFSIRISGIPAEIRNENILNMRYP